MTIRWRFSIFIGVVILMTVVLYSVGFLYSEKHHLEREQEKAQWTAAGHLAHACGQALVNRDDLAVLNFFKELNTSTGFVEAMCLDDLGRVILHSDLKQTGNQITGVNFKSPVRTMIKGVTPLSPHPPLRGTFPQAGKENKDFPSPLGRGQGEGPEQIQDFNEIKLWAYDHPVYRAGRPVSAARVVFDGNRSAQEIHRILAGTVRRSTRLALGIIAIAILLSWVAARSLTRPILALASGAKKIGGGDWTVQVNPLAPGELGVLAREFNSMTGKLGELDRLKDQIVAAVSHDLRNPLGAITASAKMLQDDNLAEQSRDQVDLIVSSVTRLSAMVSNMLDIACLQEKALVFDVKSFLLPPLVGDLVRLYKPLAHQSKKTIEFILPADLPPLWADEEKVFRIFLNLLVNAFKFTRAGDKIVISAQLLATGMVECRVTDSGRGIQQERLPHLFEPHRSRGKTPQDQSGQGAGLGLSIVKILVEGNGGTIRVESSPGQGTTFIFTIPSERQK